MKQSLNMICLWLGLGQDALQINISTRKSRAVFWGSLGFGEPPSPVEGEQLHVGISNWRVNTNEPQSKPG